MLCLIPLGLFADSGISRKGGNGIPTIYGNGTNTEFWGDPGIILHGPGNNGADKSVSYWRETGLSLHTGINAPFNTVTVIGGSAALANLQMGYDNHVDSSSFVIQLGGNGNISVNQANSSILMSPSIMNSGHNNILNNAFATNTSNSILFGDDAIFASNNVTCMSVYGKNIQLSDTADSHIGGENLQVYGQSTANSAHGQYIILQNSAQNDVCGSGSMLTNSANANVVGGATNIVEFASYNMISGALNVVARGNGNTVNGELNNVEACQDSTVLGLRNNMTNCVGSAIVGNDITMNNANNTLKTAHVVSTDVTSDSVIAGTVSIANHLQLPSYTKAQRDLIFAQEGEIIFQSDNTPGLRMFHDGHWRKYAETNDD